MKDRNSLITLSPVSPQKQTSLERLHTCSNLTTDIDRTEQFYISPKIHKKPKNLPGGPIASCSGGPMIKISQFVDHFLVPLVPLTQSYIRHSTHLINTLYELSVQPGILLCFLDVTSLYTNIPHNEGIETIKEMMAINRSPHDPPHSSYRVQLLSLPLDMAIYS